MTMKFEQQSRETNKAFAAFKTYLELGPARSLTAVAKKLGKSKSAIAAWSRKHHWQGRIAASSPPAKRLDDSQLSTLNSQLPPPPLPPDREPSPARSNPNSPSAIALLAKADQLSDQSQITNHQSQMPSSPNPWEQQPGETGKNFAAFTAWLALGPTRTLGRAALATCRTKDQLAHWSTRWRWRARAAAYHAHLAAIECKATEALVAEKSRDWAAMHEGVRRQAWQEGDDLIALAQDFKARWRDSDRLPDFGALVRALDLAFKLKQFAAGMPSEVKEVHTNITGTVEVEWEAALRKAYGPKKQDQVIDVAEVAPEPKKEVAGVTTTTN